MKKLCIMLLLFLITINNSFASKIVDDLGKQIELKNNNPRVVALGWEIMEMVIALGIKPVGVSNVSDYKKWVALNHMPDGVIDMGPRNQINLEKIYSVKPDIIIIGSSQIKYIDKLEKIAPVMFVEIYKSNENLFRNMENNFIKIGKLFDRQKKAEKIMQQTYELIKQKGKLVKDKNSPVAFARFLRNGKRFRLHGEQSMAGSVINIMGLQNAYKGKTNHWGFALMNAEKLRKLSKNMQFIYIKDEWGGYDSITKNPLWKTFPFVINKKIYSIPDVWTYGGPLSAQKIATYISNALK